MIQTIGSHTMTIDPEVKVKGQENAYKEVINTAVGGAAGVIHQVDSPTTDCQPNDNVEAMRVFMLSKKVECVLYGSQCTSSQCMQMLLYTNGVEKIFKVGMCLPAGHYVSDDDVRYIVDCIKKLISKHKEQLYGLAGTQVGLRIVARYHYLLLLNDKEQNIILTLIRKAIDPSFSWL